MKQKHPSRARAVGMLLLTGAVVPAVITLLGVLWIHSLADVLPDPVATHWGLSGTADSFGSLSSVIAWIWVVGVGIPAAATLGVIIYVAKAGADYRAVAIVATCSGTTTVVAVLMVLSTVGQQDGPDLAAWSILGAVAAGGAVGALVWFATPRQSDTREYKVEALPIGETRSHQWQGTSVMEVGAQVLVWGSVAVLAAMSIGLLIWQGTSGATVPLLLVTVLLALFCFTCTRANITVDRRGLTVASPLRWPSWKIPLSQISAVELIRVDPFVEFGGWGFRMGLGGVGIVLRKGQAIRVRKTDGSYFTVTADNASKGAAVLLSLLESDNPKG